MIKDEIQNQINIALKAGNKERVNVLRFVLSQIKYKEINSQKNITDEETINILRSEIKKRHEAIEMFKKGNRQDLVEQNLKEIVIIEEFLPASIPDAELNKIIDGILQQNQTTNQPGKIIGMVIAQVKGQAEPSKISQLVLQKLKK